MIQLGSLSEWSPHPDIRATVSISIYVSRGSGASHGEARFNMYLGECDVPMSPSLWGRFPLPYASIYKRLSSSLLVGFNVVGNGAFCPGLS